MGIYKRGDWWYIDYYYQGKRERKRISRRKAEAEAEHSKIIYEISTGKFNQQKTGKLTLTAGIKWYMETYVPQYIDSEKSRRGIADVLDRFFLAVGDLPLDEIRLKHIEAYKNQELKRVCKASIDRYLGTISGFFSRLARYEMIEFNPIAGKIIYFKDSKPRQRVGTVDELQKIAGFLADAEMKLIFLIGFYTGMRLKDICGLTTDNIDAATGTIRFRQAKTKRENIVPITPLLTDMIGRYLAGRTGPLFTMESWQASHMWRGAVLASGVKPHLQFRDIRRTFSTMLHNSGNNDIKVISELLGHARVDVSSRVYTITDIEKKRALVENLDGVGRELMK